MFTVYPTKMKSMTNMHKSFETEMEAKEYAINAHKGQRRKVIKKNLWLFIQL